MLHIKFPPNILSGSGEKLILLVLLFSVTAAIQAKFYQSEALQSGHAASEI